MSALEPCLYCPGSSAPRSRARRRRLLDTPRNRAREFRLYLTLIAPGPGDFSISLTPRRRKNRA